jgi:hypothetical protein
MHTTFRPGDRVTVHGTHTGIVTATDTIYGAYVRIIGRGASWYALHHITRVEADEVTR